jgi:hypothetical protein
MERVAERLVGAEEERKPDGQSEPEDEQVQPELPGHSAAG